MEAEVYDAQCFKMMLRLTRSNPHRKDLKVLIFKMVTFQFLKVCGSADQIMLPN